MNMFGNMLGGSGNKQEEIQELVDKLKTKANLSDEQANKVIETIRDFVIEKYPMLQGAVQNIFGNK